MADQNDDRRIVHICDTLMSFLAWLGSHDSHYHGSTLSTTTPPSAGSARTTTVNSKQATQWKGSYRGFAPLPSPLMALTGTNVGGSLLRTPWQNSQLLYNMRGP